MEWDGENKGKWMEVVDKRTVRKKGDKGCPSVRSTLKIPSTGIRVFSTRYK